MSYSDDHASTFSGDNGGELSDAPDMVRQSPTTTERVVDTQSGFLVVIKRLDSRISLSVKRRLGTPPASSIVLTPDESLKLGRILASRFETRTSARQNQVSSDELEIWLRREPRLDDERISLENGEFSGSLDNTDRGDTTSHPRQSRRSRRSQKHSSSNSRLPIKPAVAAALTLVILPVLAFGSYQILQHEKVSASHSSAATPALDVQSIESERVNKFARAFVADMLDFTPATYRVSQVQAMASMSPELLQSYWNETHFPLSAEQLKSAPQNMTLMITRVEQKRLDELTRQVDIFAELVGANSKLSTPVHLQLKIASSTEGQLRVLEQKDLSTKK